MRVNAIQLLIEEVTDCLNKGNSLAALIAALTIPDICGNVLYPKSKTGERYKKWFDEYIGNYEQSPFDKEKSKEDQLPYINGSVIYELRCSLLHEGTDDIGSKIDINDFNLIFYKSSISESKSIEQRTDFIGNGKRINHPKKIKWNINVYNLCQKIVLAAKAFLEKDVKDFSTVPTIQIENEIPEIFKTNRNMKS